MAKDLVKRYGPEDNFLDIADQNLRAELIEFLLSSVPDDGFVAGDGIFPRRGKVKSIVFATAQIVNEPDTGATDNRYTLKLLKDRFRPADSAGVATAGSGNLTVDPPNETEEFSAINLEERFPQGSGGSHLISTNGWIVRVLIATIEFGASDRRKLAYFWLPSRPLMFPVECVVDGGVAGDEDTDCSFTYEVKTEDGTLAIKTDVLPERRRMPKTTYLTESTNGAADDTSKGFAYFKADGTFVLMMVLSELPDPEPCPTSSSGA